MRRRVVEIEVVLLHVLAMIAFVCVEAEHALFENGIARVPKGQREAQILMAIADAGDAVLIPPVSA